MTHDSADAANRDGRIDFAWARYPHVFVRSESVRPRAIHEMPQFGLGSIGESLRLRSRAHPVVAGVGVLLLGKFSRDVDWVIDDLAELLPLILGPGVSRNVMV